MTETAEMNELAALLSSFSRMAVGIVFLYFSSAHIQPTIRASPHALLISDVYFGSAVCLLPQTLLLFVSVEFFLLLCVYV